MSSDSTYTYCPRFSKTALPILSGNYYVQFHSKCKLYGSPLPYAIPTPNEIRMGGGQMCLLQLCVAEIHFGMISFKLFKQSHLFLLLAGRFSRSFLTLVI